MKHNIIFGDSLQELKKIPEQSVDVVFADPPYNMQLGKDLLRTNNTIVQGVSGSKWDIFDSYQDYDAFSKIWIKEVHRILKLNGTFWVMGSYHNIFRIGAILQDLGFWILNDIIWQKSNPLPNFRGTRFTNSHETIIWATKSKSSSYIFHYRSMKIQNDDKQMQSIWEIPICSGKERIKKQGKTIHPTQKPNLLLQTIILASSNVGDTILDPFLGTGTTACVAKALSRNSIGIENNKEYYDIAVERLNNVQPIKISDINFIPQARKPRVSVSKLIAVNLIDAGAKIYSVNNKYEGTILLDGSIQINEDIKGSIHQVASYINKSSTNGWFFWYIVKDDAKVLLNQYRDNYLDLLDNKDI